MKAGSAGESQQGHFRSLDETKVAMGSSGIAPVVMVREEGLLSSCRPCLQLDHGGETRRRDRCLIIGLKTIGLECLVLDKAIGSLGRVVGPA
jgi:hypothetical protein